MRKLWLILATVLAFAAMAGTRDSQNDTFQNDTLMVTNSAVELYATSWCGYCARTRAYLQENNIDYVEFDIEQDGEALARFTQMGGQGVPLTVVKDNVIYGYNIGEIERQLGL